jgi:DNA processing protein
MNDREATIALNLLPKIGPVRVRRLRDAFGSPSKILGTPIDRLRGVEGIGNELASAIQDWENRIDLARELRRVRELELSVLTMDDELYPRALREVYDPPLLLYVRGELKPQDNHAIGIVGSRRTTHYGTSMAKKLGFQLAHAGLTVISGLARGIDTCAHEAAVAARGRTVAVIGSGLGQLYPPENDVLAEKIASGHGAVVSEFPIDMPPDKQSFPLRNRIVAGWCFGILVVEAPGRSGSLITTNQASDYGRNIYAIPGQVDRPTSVGCNRLIQSGAKLVIDAQDILEDIDSLFSLAPHAPAREMTKPKIALSSEESAVYEALGTTETQIEEVIARSNLPTQVVSTTLLRLEMKRLVKQLPGKYFVKLL